MANRNVKDNRNVKANRNDKANQNAKTNRNAIANRNAMANLNGRADLNVIAIWNPVSNLGAVDSRIHLVNLKCMANRTLLNKAGSFLTSGYVRTSVIVSKFALDNL